MNFITLKELKKMVPVASEFKRVPGLKKILEDGIEVILRKQMENHAEVVVYKNGYVSYHAHERYTVFALHNCTHYYYESQGNEHQTIPHNHFEDMEWHIRLVLEGEDRLVRNLEARESETFSYAADVKEDIMKAIRWLLKLVLVMITLPLILAVWLAKWFVVFLHHCSAWFFYLLGSVLLVTAMLSFLMQQSQGMEALQMLIGGFVIFMIPQVVGSVIVLLELAAVMLRQAWYI